MAEQYLVLTAVGTDRPGIVAELTECLAERGANVADSRMAVLGGEFALMMLVSGQPEILDTVRSEVGAAADRLGLQTILRDTHAGESGAARRIYTITVDALDYPGIVHGVTEALHAQGGNVLSLETRSYQGAVTGTPLFGMELTAEFDRALDERQLRAALAGLEETTNADIDICAGERGAPAGTLVAQAA
jgi:glycine cleavage system transcriptional repressor